MWKKIILSHLLQPSIRFPNFSYGRFLPASLFCRFCLLQLPFWVSLFKCFNYDPSLFKLPSVKMEWPDFGMVIRVNEILVGKEVWPP